MGNNIGKRNPERKRERFSKEFKLEAIRLLELGQKPATQLALELGIARNRLYKWQEQLCKAGKEHAFRGPGRKPEDEPSENERLRAALKRMTEEHDILKKAVAYFARELPWSTDSLPGIASSSISQRCAACRVLHVSRSGFYEWQGRAPSARTIANRQLLSQIRRVDDQARQAYGALLGLLETAKSAGLTPRATRTSRK